MLTWMRNLLAVNLRGKDSWLKKYPPLRVWMLEIQLEMFAHKNNYCYEHTAWELSEILRHISVSDNCRGFCHRNPVTAEFHNWSISRLDGGRWISFPFPEGLHLLFVILLASRKIHSTCCSPKCLHCYQLVAFEALSASYHQYRPLQGKRSFSNTLGHHINCIPIQKNNTSVDNMLNT